jgi:hypothetical protein
MRRLARDPEVAAALDALDRQPSRAALGELVIHLARSSDDVDRILAFAEGRVMSALASQATIRLATEREAEVFFRIPVALRRGFDVTLDPELPIWEHDCPRCDRLLRTDKESHGRATYRRVYYCWECRWCETQDTDEPTMASIYEEMHRMEHAAAIQRIVDQAARDLHTVETCWPLRGLPFDSSREYPPPMDRLRWTPVRELLVRRGGVEHVVLAADELLARGAELLERAPIRSVTLLAADDHLVELLASPVVRQLAGLALVCADREAPIMDALITAPPLPALRHLQLEGVSLNR